jgi:hypothetical protein
MCLSAYFCLLSFQAKVKYYFFIWMHWTLHEDWIVQIHKLLLLPPVRCINHNSSDFSSSMLQCFGNETLRCFPIQTSIEPIVKAFVNSNKLRSYLPFKPLRQKIRFWVLKYSFFLLVESVHDFLSGLVLCGNSIFTRNVSIVIRGVLIILYHIYSISSLFKLLFLSFREESIALVFLLQEWYIIVLFANCVKHLNLTIDPSLFIHQASMCVTFIFSLLQYI